MVDVAREANVSRATASKVLTGSGGPNTRVSTTTSERIRRVARRLNYRPNTTAQTLAGKRTRVVGAVIDAYAGVSAVRKLQIMQTYVQRQGFRLLVGYVHNSLEKIAEFADDLYDRDVEGVLCMAHKYAGFGSQIPPLFQRFPNRIFLPAPLADSDASYAEVDFEKLPYLAAHHLLNLGRKRIVFVRGRSTDSNNPFLRDWDGGFRRAHTQFGRDVEPWQTLEFERTLINRPQLAAHCLDEILRRDADGLVVTTDTSAMWLLGEIRRRGLRVPQDFALVSCQREPLGWSSDVRITSVDRRENRIALKAVQCLVGDIERPAYEPRPIQRITVPPRLVVGDSCGAVSPARNRPRA